MWKKRGSITMAALMSMLVLALYGIALYGKSVSAYVLQESQIKQLQKTYSIDIDNAYDIADRM